MAELLSGCRCRPITERAANVTAAPSAAATGYRVQVGEGGGGSGCPPLQPSMDPDTKSNKLPSAGCTYTWAASHAMQISSAVILGIARGKYRTQT